jgi:hypothetical protein
VGWNAAFGISAPLLFSCHEPCHCEAVLFRRSNLLTVLWIASGKVQERPRNDIVQLKIAVDDAPFRMYNLVR